jgi:N-acetylmuramoyl-L-alanine amidase
MRLIALLFALATSLAAVPAAAQGSGLSALARFDPGASRIADEGDGVAIDLAVSQPVPYRVLFMDNPPRLVVDFREVDFGTARPEAIETSTRIAAARWGRFFPGWSRLVLDLDGPFHLVSAEEITAAPKGAVDGALIRIRVAPTDAAAFAAAVADRDDLGWDLPEPAAVEAPKGRQTGDRPLFVVLDPGHGGIDPGAEAGAVTEADLMLLFARELSDVFKRNGIDVLMTREEDVFVPLETRISVARAAGADVFLSLHADALAEGEATGATVYMLADEASDVASARLAERHDRADLLAGVDLSGQGDEIANVLMDLARTETQPRADRLAEELARAMEEAGVDMHRHPVQEADFSVLKSPDIPSLLLEVGFLSSKADRMRLADPKQRALMQEAIAAALRTWAIADAAEARLLRQ